jgi:hypothetical protein
MGPRADAFGLGRRDHPTLGGAWVVPARAAPQFERVLRGAARAFFLPACGCARFVGAVGASPASLGIFGVGLSAAIIWLRGLQGGLGGLGCSDLWFLDSPKTVFWALPLAGGGAWGPGQVHLGWVGGITPRWAGRGWSQRAPHRSLSGSCGALPEHFSCQLVAVRGVWGWWEPAIQPRQVCFAGRIPVAVAGGLGAGKPRQEALGQACHPAAGAGVSAPETPYLDGV